jgi:hypothetical protein
MAVKVVDASALGAQLFGEPADRAVAAGIPTSVMPCSHAEQVRSWSRSTGSWRPRQRVYERGDL